ncbi:unnamed protein product [Blepharisma stoltei]|uniref:Exophilin 5 n=1 Tax=Blepharisma stoltei TaxID=1481888 RepID=A0AAU9JH97_9CILI|nr:unnamed protein product [Blepharisma stoltei]
MDKRYNQPTNVVFSGSEQPINKIISPTKIHKTTSQQILKIPFPESSYQFPIVTANTLCPPSQIATFNKERAYSHNPISFRSNALGDESPFSNQSILRRGSLPMQSTLAPSPQQQFSKFINEQGLSFSFRAGISEDEPSFSKQLEFRRGSLPLKSISPTPNSYSSQPQFSSLKKDKDFPQSPISLKDNSPAEESSFSRKLSFPRGSLPQQLIASKADKIDRPIVKDSSPRNFSSTFDNSVRSSFAGSWKMMQNGNSTPANMNVRSSAQEYKEMKIKDPQKLVRNASGSNLYSQKK